MSNGKVEELISYNQLLEHLENAQDNDMGMDQELYRFRAIIGHKVLCLPDIGNGKVEEQISYNQLVEHLENAQDHDMGMGSEPSLDTKVLCLPQIQTGKEANIMFRLNGRLGRLLSNPSPSLLQMIQSLVQHMPRKMIYLL